MLFFANPNGKVSRRGKSARRVVRRKARHTGGAMAKRKKGKRKVSRRRVRRRVTQVALRRKGVTVYRSNPKRRTRRNPGYRRNPFAVGGVVTTLKTGVKDGAIVLVAQVVTRKAVNMVGGFVPIKGIAGQAITGLGVPVLITIIARKAVPGMARLVSAAAFAEGLKGLLAATPIGAYLGDVVNAGDMSQEYGAWPDTQIPANMGAYPGMGDEVGANAYAGY